MILPHPKKFLVETKNPSLKQRQKKNFSISKNKSLFQGWRLEFKEIFLEEKNSLFCFIVSSFIISDLFDAFLNDMLNCIYSMSITLSFGCALGRSVMKQPTFSLSKTALSFKLLNTDRR